MIECLRIHLEQRASQRGYHWHEVVGCIVHEHGDRLVVDENHEAYPRVARPGSETLVSGGPGTQLSVLLASLGLRSMESCKCNDRAQLMDEMEARHPGWCESHLDEIVGWLRESARERGLPFLDIAGRALVRRAIRAARRARPA